MLRFVRRLLRLPRGVKSFALVGKSGTGKSFRAKLVAQKYDIELIIDDGLLIRDDKILAGKSAKKEKAVLGAIRTALFDDQEHCLEVRLALKREQFKRVLVLGTSERMVAKIAERLDLPAISKCLYIEDIATREEIKLARSSRQVEGSHVIPVPPLEVSKSHPHIVYDSIRFFFKTRFSFAKSSQVFEKTLVRPGYSRRGRVTISEGALIQMVLHCADEINHALNVKRVSIKSGKEGYTIDVSLHVPHGLELAGNVNSFQVYVIESIERYTGILIEEVNVTIDRVTAR